jgi:hypothetical protein
MLCELTNDVTVSSIADDCRAALLAFLAGPAGKAELASWLAGPYRLVTRHVPRQELAPRESGILPTPIRSQLRAKEVDAIFESARGEVRDALARHDSSFARAALAAGQVQRSRDPFGRSGYVPIDHERMRLADRVLSLAAADHLMRPSDYFALLVVCAECRQVSFDAEARARGKCGLHVVKSAAEPCSHTRSAAPSPRMRTSSSASRITSIR